MSLSKNKNPMAVLDTVIGIMTGKKSAKDTFSLDEIAKFLETTPEAIEAFENAYHAADFAKGLSDNYFQVNAKQASALNASALPLDENMGELEKKIVDEFVARTIVYSYARENKAQSLIDYTHCLPEIEPVTPDMFKAVPKAMQPQCLANYLMRDIPDTGISLLWHLKEAATAKTETIRRNNYHLFRQGLDILDLDELTYSMIDSNPASMGNWLPKMTAAVDECGFFKIPATKIIKVPLSMLQLTKQVEYERLTPTTKALVNDYCHRVFELNDDETYFIKTGIHCSKQDFRNAVVTGAKEVREMGEYFLFLHQQAIAMAYPLSRPCIYGAGTTVEWVVREHIKDVENNMTIYHGLPLHTEYRVFVDFDTDEVLGIHNYWDPDLMLSHFRERLDAEARYYGYADTDAFLHADIPAEDIDVDARHDYVTYTANRERLCRRYNENKDLVTEKVGEFLPLCENMHGQWALDIMQNGDDFWFIDAAPAETCTFYKATVPEEKRRTMPENWLPNVTLPALACLDTRN